MSTVGVVRRAALVCRDDRSVGPPSLLDRAYRIESPGARACRRVRAINFVIGARGIESLKVSRSINRRESKTGIQAPGAGIPVRIRPMPADDRIEAVRRILRP